MSKRRNTGFEGVRSQESEFAREAGTFVAKSKALWSVQAEKSAALRAGRLWRGCPTVTLIHHRVSERRSRCRRHSEAVLTLGVLGPERRRPASSFSAEFFSSKHIERWRGSLDNYTDLHGWAIRAPEQLTSFFSTLRLDGNQQASRSLRIEK